MTETRQDRAREFLLPDEQEMRAHWKRSQFFLPPKAAHDFEKLFMSIAALREENERLKNELACEKRTMQFWADSYLKEHGVWGNCTWRLKAEAAEELNGKLRGALPQITRNINEWVHANIKLQFPHIDYYPGFSQLDAIVQLTLGNPKYVAVFGALSQEPAAKQHTATCDYFHHPCTCGAEPATKEQHD